MDKQWRYLLVGTIISWSLGYLGADRFFKGDVLLGVIKLFTIGGFFIWWLIDACIWTYKLGQLDKKTAAKL